MLRLLVADAATSGWSPGTGAGRGGPGWYWAALAGAGQPLLHVTEWDVPPRTDPLLVKAHGLWAEHVCEAPMQQWTVANETYAVALEDPAEALGRGLRRCRARCLRPRVVRHRRRRRAVDDGFTQDGVVHGVDRAARRAAAPDEAPAQRWRRWGDRLGPLGLPDGVRPHRPPGAVRLPGRHGRRLGADTRRLARVDGDGRRVMRPRTGRRVRRRS